MATINLAGNFQPNTISNGTKLPQESTNRAPSISKISTAGSPTIPQSKKVITESSPRVGNSIITKNQRTEVGQKEVQDQIEQIQQFNQKINRTLQFEVDSELGVTIVRVIDKETEELIRQFPPEELLNLSRRLKDLNELNTGNSGVLLAEKV